MQADWFFTTGKPHHVCEDYAIKGDDCVIISDGCSSAHYTDVGARLLAHSARIILEQNPAFDWSYDNFGQAVIAQATKLINALGMKHECLYTTLIVAKVMPSGAINVKMYGDGIIITISDETIQTFEVMYTNNMPYYLGYRTNPSDMDSYKRCQNKMAIVHSVDGIVSETMECRYDYQIDYTFDPTKEHTILISSDGLSNFAKDKTRELIPLASVVHAVVDFKGLKGEFIKRRLSRVVQDMAASQVFPYDDVSVAGIYLEKGDRQWQNAILAESE